MDAKAKQTLDLRARDDRFFRAAESVLKTYKITRRKKQEAGTVIFDITGGTQDYVVGVHPEWLHNPQCSCPDAAKRAKDSTRGYCKHIIAVLLSNDEFRCQLLEVFL
ncbi:MAG: SWIM zinc finger family protein [Oligosphaeraceae bacterium]|nr:SWIM zinc finger family protein [Oligosphaeraceae bacterium]